MAQEFTKRSIGRQLEEAIEEMRILAYYQPQYDAITEKMIGAEALARWLSPKGKLLKPERFVPLLEVTGDIVRLDWYMLKLACEFLSRRRAAGERCVPIALNFSRVHIVKEPDFAQRLASCVDGYGLPHSIIDVEITESALVGEQGQIVGFLQKIRDEGFAVAIDDFGSGLSSLNFVKDVPANILKIDKSLLSHDCENEKERIVLASIFNFSHRLNMRAVVEGVETEAQLGFLRTCGAEVIQGFYFAKPMPEAEFAARLGSETEKETGDILFNQSKATTTQLLVDVLFRANPLVLMINLTRNSYYMVTKDNFSSTVCPASGPYTEVIKHGALTMHPDDSQLFADTFNRPDMLKAYQNGERQRRVVTRQKGDDGVYRNIESTIYYLKAPGSDDVLGISLSREV